MQIVAITKFNNEGIHFQWFEKSGKQKHENMYVWDDIVQADVFKRDMMIYDLICLQLSINDNEGIEIDEEDALWTDLVLKLPDYLMGCKTWSEWFADVAIPAFETNLITVYKK